MSEPANARQPAVAGTFYPGKPEQLQKMIDAFLQVSVHKEINANKIRCLIVPHAGYIYSGVVAAAGFKLLEGRHFANIILLGPSHYAAFLGTAFDDNAEWKTPLGSVAVSNFPSLNIKVFSDAHLQEHSIEVQIPFLQQVLGSSFSICPIATGDTEEDAELIADELAKQLTKPLNKNAQDILLVVSSDLSHYHPYDEAVMRDKRTIADILSLLDVEPENACGAAGINILLRIAKKLKWKPVLVDYKNSGDTAGSKSEVVGYACIAFLEGN